jgi:rhodanese-related sulfurtransferase
MMSKETTDTLGNQKKFNYALRSDMTKEEFIKALLTGLTTPPGYFPQNVLMNIKGYESLDNIMERGRRPLSAEEFETAANETQALVLDTRNSTEFARGFIPNSINIGIDGSFAQWVGEMIPGIKQEILLVTEEGREEESIIRLSRVGYDNTLGFLKGGFNAWQAAGKDTETVSRINVDEFAEKMANEVPIVIDVRKKSEYDSEHVEGVSNIPLNSINQHLAEFPKDKPFVLYCAGGYRSMLAASILKSRGWDNFVDVAGGFAAIKAAGKVPLTEYVCPTTLL